MAHAIVPDSTLRDLGWSQITDGIAARTSTPRGRERALALPFLERRDEIEASLSRIDEARELLRKELSLPVSGAGDVRDALAFAQKSAILEAAQLMNVARLIRAASRVRSFLHAHRAEVPLLAAMGGELPEATPLASRIETAFEPSGRLKDSASGMLASLRDKARGLHHQIKGRLEELMGEREFHEWMRDDYVSIRNDRYVVPINASYQSKVPGIVHNASNSGQTLFIEPQQIVGLGNELSIAESMAAEEERRVLQELSADVGDRASELLRAVEILGELDLVEACARLATDLDATRPQLAEGRASFSLRGARHPLLVLQGKRVIANDVSLAAGQKALVISGPNAGGKTVTLTTVGLFALLVRAGLPVPAEHGTTVPLYSAVYSAIGDDQDLARDLSTFSAHLTNLRRILENAREGSLVLIDEIAADTDPREGAALASAVLHELVSKLVQVLVTTHLEELKAIGLADERFANARVGLDPKTLAPTFRLELGAAGVSSALEIAARVGLPAAVLERAKQNLHGGSALSTALGKLEEERRAAELERRQMSQVRDELEKARAAAAEARTQAELARREAEARVREEMQAEVEKARRDVGELIAQLTQQKNVGEAVRGQKKLQDWAEELQRESAKARARGQAVRETGGAPVPQEIRPGTRVQVASLGREAEVVELYKDEATVAMGLLKTRVKLEDLVALPGKAAAAAGKKKGFTAGRKASVQAGEAVSAQAIAGPEARCDVRGLRAEDAVREIELFLDRAYSDGPGQLVIVHGHGTGALKKSIREALEASPYVATFRGGDRHEGGDGVTIVALRA